MRTTRISLAIKLAYTLWVLVWLGAYGDFYGPAHFLWLCNLANLLVLAGLWLESRLLLSSQLLAVALVDLVWCLDLAGSLIAGVHPLGVTPYMYNPQIPLEIRLLSLYHVFVPVLLVHALTRTGYEGRGFALQTALTWLVLPLSLLTDPARNVNWVWGPFWEVQTVMPAWAYLLVSLVAYPALVYLPIHGLVRAVQRLRASRG